MLTQLNRICRTMLTAAALGACLSSPLVLAADNPKTTNTSQADIDARYQTDVARCKAGQTNQDEATCLRETGAALEEARHHRLDDGQAASYDKNAVDRCNALPMAERQDCLTQMTSHDTVKEGSIESGGVLRETVIPVPVTPAPATVTPAPATVIPAPAPITPVPAPLK